MGRSPCTEEGMNRGTWTAAEDKILTDYIKTHGEGKWGKISKEAGLKRSGKSCRLRWLNYLRPGIKRGNISHDEEDLIVRLHKLLGNRWSLIAGRLPGRTENEIKNYWNANLRKKAQGKESKQSKNERKPMIKPPNEPSPESGVVQAKASRCTGVGVTAPLRDKAEYNNDTNVVIGPSMDCNLVKNVETESESESIHGLFTCKDKILSDFTMDFNMGEISLSEFLNPEFTQLSDFDIHDFNNVIEGDRGTNNGCKSELSPFSDQELLVSEEMVENWRGSADMDSDFLSMASSFYELADEWLWDDLNIVYPN